jgi:molecular chaperone DnaJ
VGIQSFHPFENSGPPGDLIVCLDIENPSYIKRDGTNLYSIMSIRYLEDILGTVMQVRSFSL